MDPLLDALIQSGVIDQATAELMLRVLSRDEMRAYCERRIFSAFQQGLLSQQGRLVSAVRVGPVDENFWDAEDRALYDAVQDALAEAATHSAVAFALVNGAMGMWSKMNHEALAWVNGYYTSAASDAFGATHQLNATTRREFADVYTRWSRGELGERGIPDLIDALSPTFGPNRARDIAVTETTRVFVESERAAGAVNEFTTHYVMLTAADERVCPICGPMHGQTRPKEQLWYIHPALGAMPGPPFHVRCRCGESPATAATLTAGRAEWDTYQYDTASLDTMRKLDT